MNSGAMTEDEMNYLIKKYDGDNVDKLFSTSLLSHPANSAGPRQHMFSVQYGQHVMINDPHTPRYFTSYEKTFGKYLDSFYKSHNDLEIIAKIVRHSTFPKMSYLLVVKNLSTGEYDTIKVSHYEKLSDNHGYLKPFSYMDDKNVGSIITKEDIVYKAESLDDFGNYRFGKNIKTAFMLIPEVKDDSIVISESLAEETTFNLISKIEYKINKNDVMTNIYGDMNFYKCLPNIGETVGDRGIVFAVRKMNKRNISGDFTDSALSTIYYSDNKFRGSGTVVDIDIKVNDVEELKSDMHRDQLSEIYADQFRYNKEIYDILSPIVKKKDNLVTPRLEQDLFNATNYISPNVKYSCNTGNFEFAHITIYVSQKTNLLSAMKMTNRCGSKAVIGKIWPNDHMPINSDGVRADMICSSAGVVGRANADQLLEQHTNYISDEILRRMKKCKSVSDSIDMLVEYLLTISPEWGEYTRDSFKRMTTKEKEAYLNEMYKSKLGIYVYNPPMNKSIAFSKLKELSNKYKIKVSKVKMCREYNISQDLLDLYMSKDDLDPIKSIMTDYVFDKKTELEGKGKNKKEVTSYNEFSIIDAISDTKNQLGLKAQEYKDNAWIDDYVWSDNEIGILDCDIDSVPDDLATQINILQQYDGEFDEEKLKDSVLNKDTFDTTKSKIYKTDRGTIVREFTSKYPVVISDVYFMILKHIPDNGFSARSLGSTTPMGLPNKTVKKSETGRPFSDTCNQFSDMDNCDLKRVCDPNKVSRFLAIHSTHPDLRSEKAKSLLFDDPTRLHDLPLLDEEIADTVPIKMKNSYLTALGLETLNDDQRDPYEFLDGLEYKTVADLMSKVGIVPTEIE